MVGLAHCCVSPMSDILVVLMLEHINIACIEGLGVQEIYWPYQGNMDTKQNCPWFE